MIHLRRITRLALLASTGWLSLSAMADTGTAAAPTAPTSRLGGAADASPRPVEYVRVAEQVNLPGRPTDHGAARVERPVRPVAPYAGPLTSTHSNVSWWAWRYDWPAYETWSSGPDVAPPFFPWYDPWFDPWYSWHHRDYRCHDDWGPWPDHGTGAMMRWGNDQPVSFGFGISVRSYDH